MEEEIERERNVERERCQILLDLEIGLEYNKLGVINEILIKIFVLMRVFF